MHGCSIYAEKGMDQPHTHTTLIFGSLLLQFFYDLVVFHPKWLTSTLVVAPPLPSKQLSSVPTLSLSLSPLSFSLWCPLSCRDRRVLDPTQSVVLVSTTRRDGKRTGHRRVSSYRKGAGAQRGVLIMAQRSGADDELADRLGGISLEGLSGGDGKPPIGPAGLIHKVRNQAKGRLRFCRCVQTYTHIPLFDAHLSITPPPPRSDSILTVATR